MNDIVEILQEMNSWWGDSSNRAAPAHPVRRKLQGRLRSQIQRLDDRRAVVVVGPRQVGKTVMLKQTIDDLLENGWSPRNITYFDFSDRRLRNADPVSPQEIVDLRPVGQEEEQPRVFLFDEIRDSEGWDRWLKQAVDNEIGRIAVTDSAASLLRDESFESAPGRWDWYRLEGLSFREFVRLNGPNDDDAETTLGRLPNLVERFLALGGFPEHATREDVPEARARLREDIADKAILTDLRRFGIDVSRAKDLFVYFVQESGGILNAAARADDLTADPRSVSEWHRLLEETMLIVSLPRFTGRPAVSLRSKPKVYAADHGLIRAFSTSPWSNRAVARSFEASVYRHLRELVEPLDASLGYFRDSRGSIEADFVLNAENRTLVIEVTSSSRIRPEKLARVRKVADIVEADRQVLVHGGLRQEIDDGVVLIPLPRFLLDPESIL